MAVAFKDKVQPQKPDAPLNIRIDHGWLCAHMPACCRRIGLLLTTLPQNGDELPVLLCLEHQAPCRRHVKVAWIALYLEDNACKFLAFCRLVTGPQSGFQIDWLHHDKARRIKPEHGQSGREKLPAIKPARRITDPDNPALSLLHASGQKARQKPRRRTSCNVSSLCSTLVFCIFDPIVLVLFLYRFQKCRRESSDLNQISKIAISSAIDGCGKPGQFLLAFSHGC